MLHFFGHSAMIRAALPICAVVAAAQTVPRVPSTVSGPEATRLAQIWTDLAQDRTTQAAAASARLLAASPRSPSALIAGVEADLAHRGALPALTAYEKWLGKKADAPYVLRDIARMRLREIAHRPNDIAAGDAIAALYRDGDPTGTAAVTQGAQKGTAGDVRLLAASGDPDAVNELVTALEHAGAGDKTKEIDALGESHNAAAVPVLTKLLTDPVPQNQVEAITALGTVAGAQAIDAIKPLLQNEHGFVRQTAASVLYGFGDDSGLSMLRELTRSDVAAVRAGAARLLASHPDADWQSLVTQLTTESSPEIRLEAAQLIAPYNAPLARATLLGLQNDTNPEIRRLADRAIADTSGNDFASLRALLRSDDGLTAVHAADRILTLTR